MLVNRAREERTSGEVAQGKESPTASIIVVNYNGGQQLLLCLDALGDSLPDWAEVILVDNDSADGSARRAVERHPTITLLSLGENLGFGRACNLAAERSESSFLVFLNPDTIVSDGWLEALIGPFERDEMVGMTTARILLADDPKKLNAAGNDLHVSGLTMCRGMGRPSGEFQESENVAAASGAACVIRRSLFDELDGFDPDFFLYMDDTDLSLRCRLAGREVLYVADAVVSHEYQLTFFPQKVYLQERNRYQMLLKSYRWWTLLVLLPVLLLAEAVTWGYVLWSEPARWRNKVRAYMAIRRQWGSIMSKRAAAQRLRAVRDRELLAETRARIDFGQVDRGLIGRLAKLVFDPLFAVLRAAALLVVRW